MVFLGGVARWVSLAAVGGHGGGGHGGVGHMVCVVCLFFEKKARREKERSGGAQNDGQTSTKDTFFLLFMFIRSTYTHQPLWRPSST